MSFPNFGYWSCRAQLTFYGRMLITNELKLTWYDTKIYICVQLTILWIL